MTFIDVCLPAKGVKLKQWHVQNASEVVWQSKLMQYGLGGSTIEQDIENFINGWSSTVSYVAKVHKSNFGFPVSDTCCTDADAWWVSIDGKQIV